MLFRKKNILFFTLACFSFFFLSFFINSKDVNAWQTTDPYFSSSQSFDVYRSYMTVAEGAPYIENHEHLSSNFHVGDYILGPTDSNIQLRTLFSFLVAGYEFNGDDISKTYHSAQAVLYFTSVNSTYKDFGSVPIVGKYVLTDDNGNNISQYVDCQYVHNQDSVAPYTISFFVECPQVTIKRQGYHYKWFDLTVGTLDNNNTLSDYFYKYRDGGGFKIAPAVGQYVVSSTDNEELLALENQTYIIEYGFNNIYNSINDHYDRENESVDNISNQSPSDIQGTENQKTSDLITALGSLVTAFVSIQPADNCEIQLDFPIFAGGSKVINPCQYKEKAPDIVLIGASVFLVLFALKYWNAMSIKIYKVIRSFIDGTDDTEGEE